MLGVTRIRVEQPFAARHDRLHGPHNSLFIEHSRSITSFEMKEHVRPSCWSDWVRNMPRSSYSSSQLYTTGLMISRTSLPCHREYFGSDSCHLALETFLPFMILDRTIFKTPKAQQKVKGAVRGYTSPPLIPGPVTRQRPDFFDHALTTKSLHTAGSKGSSQMCSAAYMVYTNDIFGLPKYFVVPPI